MAQVMKQTIWCARSASSQGSLIRNRGEIDGGARLATGSKVWSGEKDVKFTQVRRV